MVMGAVEKLDFWAKTTELYLPFCNTRLASIHSPWRVRLGALLAIAFLSVQPLLGHGEKSQVPFVTHHSTF
jgi:hypothetical protein